MNPILLLIAAIAFASPVLATDLYTSSKGSDVSNNCQNIAAPCDLTNGLAYEMTQVVASHGDVLYMCAGACDGAGSATVAIFVNDQKISIPSGTSFANALTVTSYPGETITWQPSSGCEFGLGIRLSAYTIWQNFTIDALNCNGTAYMGLMIGGGIVVGDAGANHNRFQNLEVKNATGNGVLVSDTNAVSPHNEFINLNVHDNSTSGYGHGIYVCASDQLVDGGEYRNQVGSNLAGTHNNFGVQVYCMGPGAYRNIVRNVRVHDNAKGVVIGTGDDNVLYNNLVYNNPGMGIGILHGNRQLLYNNTIIGTTNDCAVEVDAGINHVVENNIFWNDQMNKVCINGSTASLTQSNNLSSDPLFRNEKGADYQLSSASPAIDAGVNISTVSSDMNGIPRPQGVRTDIGAYEYTTSTGVTEIPGPPANLRITSIQ